MAQNHEGAPLDHGSRSAQGVTETKVREPEVHECEVHESEVHESEVHESEVHDPRSWTLIRPSATPYDTPGYTHVQTYMYTHRTSY